MPAKKKFTATDRQVRPVKNLYGGRIGRYETTVKGQSDPAMDIKVHVSEEKGHALDHKEGLDKIGTKYKEPFPHLGKKNYGN